MKLFEEFKLYENMWEPGDKDSKVLKEAIDFVTELKTSEIVGSPWYTEYFAVGPACYDKSTNEVFTPEDFEDSWEEFEECLNDAAKYSIIPIVFGPHMNRTYSNEQYDTLEEALDNVIENLYSDSDLSAEISSHSDLFDIALMEPHITDNSATFIVAYAPDVQDSYGCYMRVSQKPLKSNRQLGKYYMNKPASSGPHLLANLMDTGLVGEEYSNYSNFDKNNYSWQAK